MTCYGKDQAVGWAHAQPQKTGRNASYFLVTHLPACWVLGEATGFRDFPWLRRGDSPAETGRERDQERQRHREGETDKEEEIVKEVTVRDGSRGEKRGEATDRLTQEIRRWGDRDKKTAHERQGHRQ